ncbi:putative choline kinase [Spiroplasma chinense]|uniref:Putative choline kinase n=1 Tax=Spiroplasma chinense TaxID=216932 RepID=A0A5B9Y3Z0_9MOLU|nr:phosphotransferase [Spiroplasma chinense]QEH61741.1 putative choline kinase [Spiroplasma chinense]
MNFNFKGLTNDILVEDFYVIKTSKPLTEKYLDKTNEVNVLLDFLFLDQDVMVKPREFKFEDQRLVSSFKVLLGYESLEQNKLEKKHLPIIADGIKKFHSLTVSTVTIKSFDYLAFLEFFENNINKLIYELSFEIKEIKEEIKLLKNLEKVISHNDLVPGNILFKGDELKFIDYDYVKFNDKFFDYASFITETCNDNQEFIDEFIEILKEKEMLKEDELKYLNISIKYQDIVWTLWANYMFENTGEQIYKDICDEKYLRIKNRIKI